MPPCKLLDAHSWYHNISNHSARRGPILGPGHSFSPVTAPSPRLFSLLEGTSVCLRTISRFIGSGGEEVGKRVAGNSLGEEDSPWQSSRSRESLEAWEQR
jgi:hypothetical protein